MKRRLDQLLVDRGLVDSRSRAQALVMAGLVFSGERRLDKAGQQVADDTAIEVRGQDHPWVSRGGLKLAHALSEFAIDVSGAVGLDVGASTGGFTDVLLAHGAAKVYAVDVGHGQLAWKLRSDPRVVVLEKTNARHLTADQVPEPVDIVVCDASFISLRTIMPAVLPHVREGGFVVAMVKPQFEAGRENVKKGVVRDPVVIVECSDAVAETAAGLGWVETGRAAAPIQGPKGNQEVFLLLTHRAP